MTQYLISLGIPFSKKMINLVSKAQGFNDRLAIYTNEDKSRFVIHCTKTPTPNQIELFRKRLSNYSKIVEICFVMNDGFENIETKSYSLYEMLNEGNVK